MCVLEKLDLKKKYKICLRNLKADSSTQNLHVALVFRDYLNILELCEDYEFWFWFFILCVWFIWFLVKS